MCPAPIAIFGPTVARHRTSTARGRPVSVFARLSRCRRASLVSVTHHASSPGVASHVWNQLISNPLVYPAEAGLVLLSYTPRYSATVSARTRTVSARAVAGDGGTAPSRPSRAGVSRR